MKPKNKPDKRVRMIEIRGIGGLLKLVFIGVCLVAGFGVFPGVALMYLWNNLLSANSIMPSIGLVQGLLLYGIFVMIYFLRNKPKFSISCGSFSELSDDELEKIIMNAKLDAEKRMSMSSFDICKAKLDEIEQQRKEEMQEDKEKKEV